LKIESQLQVFPAHQNQEACECDEEEEARQTHCALSPLASSGSSLIAVASSAGTTIWQQQVFFVFTSVSHG